MSSVHKILLVDDDILSVETLKMLLENILSKEFVIKSTYSGNNALDEIINESFDVIFLDNKLPDRDGLSILEEIKSRKISSKVIFLTGFNDEEIVEKALKLGALEVLPKGNTDINKLIDVVNTAFTELKINTL